MEYTFENGVMMGLILADSCATDVDEDEISKIKNGLLKYILQKGIYQGTVKLVGSFSVKFYCGFLPRRDDPAAELFLCTDLGHEYTTLGPNIISDSTSYTVVPERIDTYKVLNLYSGEDAGLANRYLVRIWCANVLFKGGTPLGATFYNGNYSMDMTYKGTYTYSTKDGYDRKISHIYLYPTKGYTDVTLTLPGDTLSGTAEYTCDSKTGGINSPTVPDQGSSESFMVSYKLVTYNIKRPTYKVTNDDGSITEKTDWSAKPILYATKTTEYSEKYLSGSNSGGIITPRNIRISDLSNKEILNLEKEYIEETLKIFNHKRNNSIYEIKKFLSYIIEEV